MANEATLVFETGPPIPFTVTDGTGIEMGATLKMSDPMTAAACAADNDIVAGIAASEKVASDGKTKLGVYRQGIFKMYASGSISVGDAVGLAVGPPHNTVASQTAVTSLSGSKTLGIALETATDGETFLVELRPSCSWPES
jgi:hypothetical protein